MVAAILLPLWVLGGACFLVLKLLAAALRLQLAILDGFGAGFEFDMEVGVMEKVDVIGGIGEILRAHAER